MSTISPNMNLIVPVVGSTPGPDWASDLNSSLTLVDLHDHTPGKGVPITPAGISINADLSFDSNNATSLRSARFTSQIAPLDPITEPTDIGAIYVSGADLYYNDTAGNQIRLTIGGSPNSGGGNISGLVSPASASYSTGTFLWESDALTPAAMDQGPTTIREGIASGNGITLVTTGALASNYSITLPLLPVSQKIMTLDASGNMTAPYIVDGSTITISSNIIGVPTGGIGQTQLAPGSVINSKLGLLAVQTANIDNLAVTAGKLAAAITGTNTTTTVNATPSATITVTLTGRPVLLIVSSASPSTLSSNGACSLMYTRGGSTISSFLTFTGAQTKDFNTASFLDTSGATGSTTFGLASSNANAAAGSTLTLKVIQL